MAWNAERWQSLPALLARAYQNGVTDACLWSAAAIYQHEPHLNQGALGGLYVPGEGILCTFTLPLALATPAVVNGVTLKLNFPVEQITALADEIWLLQGTGGTLRCRYLVNAAGLYSDDVDRLMGHQTFTVTPGGELIVFDKLARGLIKHVLLPVPTATTKGVLVSPTVYGNVLLGPTAEDLADKTNTATSAAGLSVEKGRAILPALLHEKR